VLDPPLECEMQLPSGRIGMPEEPHTGLLTPSKKPEGDQPGNGQRGAEQDKPAQERPKRPLRRRMARHPLRFLLLIIGILAVIVGGDFLWRYFQSYESTDDAYMNAYLNPVSSRINGTVIGVYTDNNQTVVRNQTLVDLDPRDFQVAVEQARANLVQAQGALAATNPNVPITQTTNIVALVNAQQAVSSAEAALSAAQHDYDSAVADLRQAEANNIEAQADEKRYAQLVAKDEVSRESYDEKLAAARAQAAQVDSRKSAAEAAQRAVSERQAALEQARSTLSQVQSNNPRQLAVRQADIKAQQGAVKVAQAQLDNALLQLSYCKILAPVAGVVGDKHVEVGQRVQPGDQLLIITEIENQWVDANFKETQIVHMHPGQRVTIHVDALEQDFHGYIENMPGGTGATYSLLPPENATGNFVKVVQRLPVRIRFKPGQRGLERLRPGMSVEPKVWLNS
jgi:membrane fusion protein, multidrug efflux system